MFEDGVHGFDGFGGGLFFFGGGVDVGEVGGFFEFPELFDALNLAFKDNFGGLNFFRLYLDGFSFFQNSVNLIL